MGFTPLNGNQRSKMKAHYRKTAQQLTAALQELDQIEASSDLAHLHRFVVDLKTGLPERLAYENSQLLLGGLRVTKVEGIPLYAMLLRARLTTLHDDYLARSR